MAQSIGDRFEVLEKAVGSANIPAMEAKIEALETKVATLEAEFASVRNALTPALTNPTA
jgi:hypothetical protein